MTENLQQSVNDLDKDLSPSWIALSSRVRNLSDDLKLKASATEFSGDAAHLSQEISRLCDHVEKLHADVIDLVENLETRIPLHTPVSDPPGAKPDEIEKESIQIQRESHELRGDFKDVLKALFLWVDDPKERAKSKQ